VLKAKIVWILGVALLLALVLAHSQYQRAERYKGEAKAAQAQAQTLLETVASKDVVISQFEEAAAAATAIANAQKKTLDAAVKNVRELKKHLSETRLALQLREEADHAIPECQKLLNMDWNLCPGHAASMWERANDSVQGQDSTGAAAGAGGSTPGIDSGLPADLHVDPNPLWGATGGPER